ncbi:uncharacterized protein LOC132686805 [Panthera onca]
MPGIKRDPVHLWVAPQPCVQLRRECASVSETRVKRGGRGEGRGLARRAPPPRPAPGPAGRGPPGPLSPPGSAAGRSRAGARAGRCLLRLECASGAGGPTLRACAPSAAPACDCGAVCVRGWRCERVRLPGRPVPAAARRGKPAPGRLGRSSGVPRPFRPLLLRPGLATAPVITRGRDAAASPALAPPGRSLGRGEPGPPPPPTPHPAPPPRRPQAAGGETPRADRKHFPSVAAWLCVRPAPAPGGGPAPRLQTCSASLLRGRSPPGRPPAGPPAAPPARLAHLGGPLGGALGVGLPRAPGESSRPLPGAPEHRSSASAGFASPPRRRQRLAGHPAHVAHSHYVCAEGGESPPREVRPFCGLPALKSSPGRGRGGGSAETVAQVAHRRGRAGNV